MSTMRFECLRRFIGSESGALSGALSKDWLVIAVAMVGLIGSSLYTMHTSRPTGSSAEGTFMSSSIGEIGCTISGVLGNACQPPAPTARYVISENQWQNWCSRPNGARCAFRQQDVAMSDGNVWKVIEITAPNGTRQVVWRDHAGRTVQAPQVG